jgi:hypothetical protein
MGTPNVIFIDTLDSSDLEKIIMPYAPREDLLFQGTKDKAKEEASLMGSNDNAELVTVCREKKCSETGKKLKGEFYRITSYIKPTN